jgi:hypothetical protein
VVVHFKKGQNKEEIARPYLEAAAKLGKEQVVMLGIAQAFWKTNAYAPFPLWLWLNGHEWAKRQLNQAGIG